MLEFQQTLSAILRRSTSHVTAITSPALGFSEKSRSDAIIKIKSKQQPRNTEEKESFLTLVLFSRNLEDARTIIGEQLPQIMSEHFPNDSKNYELWQLFSGILVANLSSLARCGELSSLFMKSLIEYYEENPVSCEWGKYGLVPRGPRVPFTIISLTLIYDSGSNHTILFLAPIESDLNDFLQKYNPRERIKFREIILKLKCIKDILLIDPYCKVICKLDSREIDVVDRYLHDYVDDYVGKSSCPEALFQINSCPPIALLDKLRSAEKSLRETHGAKFKIDHGSIFGRNGLYFDGLGNGVRPDWNLEWAAKHLTLVKSVRNSVATSDHHGTDRVDGADTADTRLRWN